MTSMYDQSRIKVSLGPAPNFNGGPSSGARIVVGGVPIDCLTQVQATATHMSDMTQQRANCSNDKNVFNLVSKKSCHYIITDRKHIYITGFIFIY